MKIAPRHTRERVPASFRQIGIAIGLASLMIVAGCGSQPSLGELPYHHVAAVGQCREGSIMVCKINSTCRCHIVDTDQDRFKRVSTRGRPGKRRPNH
jgi:hypothetical protein